MEPDHEDVNTEVETSTTSEATSRESQTEKTQSTEKVETLQNAVSDVLEKHFPGGEKKAQEEGSVKEINRTEESKVDDGRKVEKKPESIEQDKEKEKQVDGSDKDKDKKRDEHGNEIVDEKKLLTDDELAKLPKRAQERIRELVDERKKVEAEFKEPATRMRNVEQFCQKNQIAGVDFDNSLKLLALVRTNPAEGIKALEAELVALKQATGQLLPQDLQKKVDDGLVDPETAKEMAKLRLEAQGRKTDAEKFQKQNQQSTQQQLTSATQQWEQSKITTDPDFKPAVADAPPGKYEMTFLMFKDKFFNGPPLYKVTDAIALLEKCYDQVNATVKQFQPRPQRRAPVRSSNASSRQEKEEPKSDITKPGWAKSVVSDVLAKRGIER